MSDIINAVRTWLFFYDDEEDEFTFEVEAPDPEEAFDKAYEIHGAQVEQMYCREIIE